jgi:hypothetical protein
MNIFNRKGQKTIDFISGVEGLTEAVPIRRAIEMMPDWAKACRKDFTKDKTQPLHLAKCPGIFDLYKVGYVVPMWCDVAIETQGDTFRWTCQEHIKRLERVDHPSGELPIVTNHSYDNIAKFLPRRNQSIANIIKIDTPWAVVAPPGVKFLTLPFPYPDHQEFDACPGILDPAISTEVNIQMYWNVKNKDYLLKAGTPMQILVPLTENNYKYNVRDANENDKKWFRRKNFLAHFKINVDRKVMKSAYSKFWNNGK